MSEYQKLQVKFNSMKKSCANPRKWVNFYVKVCGAASVAFRRVGDEYEKLSALATEVEIIRSNLGHP
jgi:hypothetical protein